jgi:hypothetical protein
MSLKIVRKQDRSKMADKISALTRRKNKEGGTKEERKKETRKEGRKKKKGRKKESILSAECERDTKNSVSSPTRIEPGSSLIHCLIVMVLLAKSLIGLYKNYRIVN